MRDHDSFNPAQFFNSSNGVVVKVSDAVPEDVSAWGAAEKGALADSNFWNCIYTYQSRMVLVHDEFIVVLS